MPRKKTTSDNKKTTSDKKKTKKKTSKKIKADEVQDEVQFNEDATIDSKELRGINR